MGQDGNWTRAGWQPRPPTVVHPDIATRRGAAEETRFARLLTGMAATFPVFRQADYLAADGDVAFASKRVLSSLSLSLINAHQPVVSLIRPILGRYLPLPGAPRLISQAATLVTIRLTDLGNRWLPCRYALQKSPPNKSDQGHSSP